MTRITITRTRTVTETATIDIPLQPDVEAQIKASIEKTPDWTALTLAPLVEHWQTVAEPSFRNPYTYTVQFGNDDPEPSS